MSASEGPRGTDPLAIHLLHRDTYKIAINTYLNTPTFAMILNVKHESKDVIDVIIKNIIIDLSKEYPDRYPLPDGTFLLPRKWPFAEMLALLEIVADETELTDGDIFSSIWQNAYEDKEGGKSKLIVTVSGSGGTDKKFIAIDLENIATKMKEKSNNVEFLRKTGGDAEAIRAAKEVYNEKTISMMLKNLWWECPTQSITGEEGWSKEVEETMVKIYNNEEDARHPFAWNCYQVCARHVGVGLDEASHWDKVYKLYCEGKIKVPATWLRNKLLPAKTQREIPLESLLDFRSPDWQAKGIREPSPGDIFSPKTHPGDLTIGRIEGRGDSKVAAEEQRRLSDLPVSKHKLTDKDFEKFDSMTAGALPDEGRKQRCLNFESWEA